MITGTLKSKLNNPWPEFWAGSTTNPLTVIEQSDAPRSFGRAAGQAILGSRHRVAAARLLW